MLIDLNSLFTRRCIRPNAIVHCGANFGQERDIYSKHCKGQIVWVEALPEVFQKLSDNLRRDTDDYKNHVAICACISDVDGQTVQFHRASNEGQSSSMLDLALHAVVHPTVTYVDDILLETARMDTLLAENEIEIPFGSFLSIDLQGADLLALKSFGALLNRFDYLYIECNERELYKGCALWPEVRDYVAGFGFIEIERKMAEGCFWGDVFLFSDPAKKPTPPKRATTA